MFAEDLKLTTVLMLAMSFLIIGGENDGEPDAAAVVGGGSVDFACKREATPIKTNLSVPIAAGMVTA